MKKELLKLKAYGKVAKMDAALLKTHPWLLMTFQYVLEAGVEVRNSVIHECPEFIDVVYEIAKSVREEENSRIAAATSVLALFGLTNTPDGKEEHASYAAQLLVDFVSKQTGDMSFILSCIQSAASMDNARPVLAARGMIRALQASAHNPNSYKGFVASLIIALLSASDISAPSSGVRSSLSLPASVVKPADLSPAVSQSMIQQIVDAVKSFCIAPKKTMETTPGFSVDCKTTLIALRSFAGNEENIQELKNNHVDKIMLDLLRNRKDDLLNESVQTLEQAIRLIWVLSFDEELKTSFIEGGIIDVLRNFEVDENQVCKEVIDGALWTLLTGPSSERYFLANSANQGLRGQFVMISYCWQRQGRVKQLGKFLESHDIPVWIDFKQKGNSNEASLFNGDDPNAISQPRVVLEEIMEAIERAFMVIICLSSEYKQSSACRNEAEHAYRLKKHVICVKAEDGYMGDEWLWNLTSKSMCFAPWSLQQDQIHKVNGEQLVKVIKKFQ